MFGIVAPLLQKNFKDRGDGEWEIIGSISSDTQTMPPLNQPYDIISKLN
jgi:hypothetical protein